jgi:uncharacterized membrane protein YfcA
MFWATLGMTWIFGCVAVLLIIWHLRSKRYAEKERLIHEERMKAMEKGVPLPEFPDLSEEAKMQRFNTIFTPPKLNPRWPLGVGVLLIFFGAGWVVAWLLSSDPEAAKILSMGLVSVFLGFGLFLYYYLTRQPEKP